MNPTSEDYGILSSMMEEHGVSALLEVLADLCEMKAEDEDREDFAEAADVISQAATEIGELH